jgi:hypothetical protein
MGSMGDGFSPDGHGELAWVRVELDLLCRTGQLPPRERARREELLRRERALLRVDEQQPA